LKIQPHPLRWSENIVNGAVIVVKNHQNVAAANARVVARVANRSLT
jgi:hypothetical protein